MFLTVLQTGKYRIKVPADSVYGFASGFLLVSSQGRGKRERESTPLSLMRALIPFMQAPPS